MPGTVHNLSEHSLIPAAAGIGLRFAHHELVLQARPDVAWFEVHAENFFGGGAVRRVLENVRRDYPLSLHGVGLSLGSAEPLDGEHLHRLAGLVRSIEPGLDRVQRGVVAWAKYPCNSRASTARVAVGGSTSVAAPDNCARAASRSPRISRPPA